MTMLLQFLFFLSAGSSRIYSYEIGDCGIRYEHVPTNANVVPSKQNEFPWLVALYRMDNYDSKYTYSYICVGSIISANIILTAAHCVFDEGQEDIDYKRMVVAVGKYNASWEHRDVHEQRFEVMSKKVPSAYKGSKNKFQDDIALLALNDSIKFSNAVMPVCIDWAGLYEPSEEEAGTMVGWSYNESGGLNEEPQISQMQQSSIFDCYRNVGRAFISYLTWDKFCAIKKDNSSVERGYSGGVLVFTRDMDRDRDQGDNMTDLRYIAKGILSIRENSGKSYYFFTNITNHMPWLNNTLLIIKAENDAGEVCGERHIQSSANDITRYENYPWIATIYMTKENKFFGIRGVGSIIHPRAIITNIWCIRDRRPHYKGVEYKILVGKKELNMLEKEKTQQELHIVKSHTQSNYLDWNTRVENEMAILIVDKDIEFSKSVTPICIDWDRKYPIDDKSVGMITSWDTNGCHCQVMAMYKYFDIENCYKSFGDIEEYHSYISSEKVCGRFVNGTRFLHGSDVGSGYFFLKNGTTRHYLQGIVSKGRPPHQEFLTFTNVELNLRWINDILLTIYNSPIDLT